MCDLCDLLPTRAHTDKGETNNDSRSAIPHLLAEVLVLMAEGEPMMSAELASTQHSSR